MHKNIGVVAHGTSNELTVELVTGDTRALVALVNDTGEIVVLLSHAEVNELRDHLTTAAMQVAQHESEAHDGQ